MDGSVDSWESMHAFYSMVNSQGEPDAKDLFFWTLGLSPEGIPLLFPLQVHGAAVLPGSLAGSGHVSSHCCSHCCCRC